MKTCQRLITLINVLNDEGITDYAFAFESSLFIYGTTNKFAPYFIDLFVSDKCFDDILCSARFEQDEEKLSNALHGYYDKGIISETDMSDLLLSKKCTCVMLNNSIIRLWKKIDKYVFDKQINIRYYDTYNAYAVLPEITLNTFGLVPEISLLEEQRAQLAWILHYDEMSDEEFDLFYKYVRR